MTIRIALDSEGKIHEVSTASSSGNEEFDQVAREILGDLEMLAKPPPEWVSDDDRVHITWSFARDKRQAGAASASLQRVKLPLTEALPRLLASGAISSAAHRILQEGRKGQKQEVVLLVVDQVIGLGLAQEDPKLVTMALEAVADGERKQFAPQVRAALSSADQRVAAAAARALGVVGDKTDQVRLASLARGQSGASSELSGSAAQALVALGQGQQTRRAALADLSGKDASARLASLAVFSQLESADAVRALSRILGGGARSSRAERTAAAGALGRQALKSPLAVKALIAGSGTADAAVRASCVAGIAQAAKAGLRNRIAYWKMMELVRNKDERVRAAAIQAAALLDPTRFAKELPAIKAGGSQLVVLSIASVLGELPGDVALSRLLDLASVRHVGMRTAAARGLGGHPGEKAGAALQVLLTDESPVVRAAAVAVLSGEQVLTPFLSDDDRSVQSIALTGLVRSLGRDKTTKLVTTKLAASGSDRELQLLLARAWLTGK
jgi:TonB family protein